MRTKDYFNNSGYSLVFSIIALSVITGLTAYLMDSKKVNSVDSARARSTSLVEVEKSRIATALSDNSVCADTLQANSFYNKAATRPDIASISARGGSTLVAKNQEYHNGLLKVSNISTRRMISTDPGYFAGAEATDNGWILQIDYTESIAGNKNFSGKKNTFALIPMYMKVVGANITNCYALGQNEKIHIAIKDSCSPETLAALTNNRNSTKNVGATIESDCEHKIVFQDTTLDQTSCIDTNDPANVAGGQTNALIGFNIDSTTGELTFLTNKCMGIDTTCLGATAMWKITNSVPSCEAPGFNRAAPCAAGEVLYKNAAGDYRCVSVNCPIADQFVQSVGVAGATCYQARTDPCGANRYVKDFNPDGSVDCAELPVTTANCGPNEFGQNITRNAGNYNGVMSCLAMTAKACVNPGRTNFVTGFNDSTTATCIISPPGGASCNVDGFNVPHLGTVTAYLAADGNPCVSETRTCNNGSLSGTYTYGACNNSCAATTMAPLCNVPASNHNAIAGACTSGYGTCSYKCTNGSWLPQIANTCSNTPPPPCLARTDSFCDLPETAAGSSTAGTCIGGTSGSCSYSCSGAGAWAKVTNTCRLPFDCIASDIDGCTVPYRSNGASGGANCGIGLTGACNYSCVDGIDTLVSNTCSADCSQDGQSVPAFTSYNFYSVSSVPFGNVCPVPASRYCDIADNFPTIPTTYTPVLGPPATHPFRNCVVNPPADCAFQQTIGTCTSSNYTTSGSSSGTCNAGYTGSCSIDCFNGGYSAGANSCLQNCNGNTFAGCTVVANSSGNTTAGVCGAGYTGNCSYLCTNGNYSPVTTCTPSATCPTPKRYGGGFTRCQIDGPAATGSNFGLCTNPLSTGDCEATCNNDGTWTLIANNCIRDI